MSQAEDPASRVKRPDPQWRSTWIWGVVCGFLLLGAMVLGASAIAGRSAGAKGADRIQAAVVAAAADEPSRSDPGASRRTAIVEAAHRVGQIGRAHV